MHACSQCGTTLGGYGPAGLCPRCMLLDGLGEDDARRFGEYELIEEIARGGMGVVWKARQLSLNRTVAVKLMLSGAFAQPEFVKRFRTEAEAAASLQHPNIVAIHEIGEHDGQPFFSMDYVQGQNLAQLVRDRPLPARRAATYLKTIAEAVHYAHEHQILHRDLKPSNILIDAADQPRITDFGLAKRFGVPPSVGQGASEPAEVGTPSDLTLTGQVLGSPNYLPPEQAEGRHREIGPASDVYSLGAVLYCLLTGRAPFQAETVTETLKQVSGADAVSPRLLNPSVPRDLETICLKCLEKDIPRRYGSAQDLADELGRFLRSEPILARPVSAGERVWRWCKRKPVVAGLGAGLVVVFLVGFAGVTWEWRRTQAQRLRAERNEAAARQSEQRLAENLYAADISLAQQSLNDNNLGRARLLLEQYRPRPGQPDLRGWEWRYLWQESRKDAETEFSLPPNCSALGICPSGRWLGVGSVSNVIELWDLALRKPVRLIREPSSGVLTWHTAVAFAPTSNRMAVTAGEGRVSLWQLDPPQKLDEFAGTNIVGRMLFSPDGRLLAVREHTLSGPNYVSLWTVTPLQCVRRITLPRGDLLNHGMAFRPDGAWLAVGTQDGKLLLLDSASGDILRSIETPTRVVIALAWSPDEKWLASAAGYDGDPIRLWDAASGEARGELAGHRGWICDLHFTADGNLLCSSGSDQTVRVWDVAGRRQQSLLRGHHDTIHSLYSVTKSNLLWTASNDGTLMLWSTGRDPGQKTRQILDRFGTSPIFSADGRHIGAIMDQRIVIRDAGTLAVVTNLAPPHTNVAEILGFGRDRLTFAGSEGPLQVWSLQERRIVMESHSFTPQRGPMTADAAGRHLLQLDLETFTLHAWEFDTGRTNGPIQLQRPREGQSFGPIFAVSPDLRTLVMFEANRTMHWWNLPDGKHAAVFPAQYAGNFCAITFSPDSRWVVTAGHNGVWKLWDVATRSLVRSERGFLNGILGLAFSPDSQRLATTSSGRESVKLWDVATGRELLRLDVWRDLIWDVGFAPDGSALYVRNRPGSLSIWRTPSLSAIDATAESELHISPGP